MGSYRQWLPLAGIVLSVFIFNTSEFMPIALLTDIGTDLGTTEAQTGIIVSAYAWAVAILSLPLMLIFSRSEFRRLLLCTVAVFMAFQFVSGFATDFWVLMAARIGVACSHAVFWSIASPLAVRVVPKEYRPMALSAVAAGTSVAMIAGLPLGRVIGLALGWRMTFIAIGLMGLAAILVLASVFPKVPNEGTFTLSKMPEILGDRVLMGIYVAIILLVTGYFTGYSYIEPFMMQVAAMSEGLTTAALTAFGAAGIVGSILFSKMYGSKPRMFTSISVCLLTASLLLLPPSSAGGYVAVMAVCALWGIAATGFNISLQSELIKSSPRDGTAVAMSLYSGIFNAGIASGTLIGGSVCTYLAIDYIGLIGGVIAGAGALFCMVPLFRWMDARRAETVPDECPGSPLDRH